jgi:leucine dehydrogenase
MEELIRNWDGERVVVRYDAMAGAWMFVAVHDQTLGMALGGCRFKMYTEPREALRDALRLARGMTYKWAAVELPFGGGKAVIAPTHPLDADEREHLLLRFGEMLHSLGGMYGTGIDLGTSPQDMNVIGRRAEWVFGRTPDQGGSGDPGPWTAKGVHAGLRAACEHVFGDISPAGRAVLVQGVGGVGAPLARRLAADGARIMISDALPARATALAAELGADIVKPEAVYSTPCDVFAPCAIGGIINQRSIAKLQCRIVAGSANNQLERDADADALHARGILYVPDFVINAGGAIAHASLELLRWTEQETSARVQRIQATVAEILEQAAGAGESPLNEATRRAERVLANARAAKQREVADERAIAR